MMSWITEIFSVLLSTIKDVAPILIIIVFFQLFVIKRQFAQLKNLMVGMVYVILGITFFWSA